MKVQLLLTILATLLLISPGDLVAEEPAAGSKAQVEIFTTSWCPYCVKATNFLRANGIPFVEYDIEKDAKAAQRLQTLTNRGGVPFAIINGRKIQGWSEDAYKRALGIN